MRIVWLDQGTFSATLEVTKPAFPHEWVQHAKTGRSQVVERLQGASIAVVSKVPIGRDEIAQLPDLKLIAISATGYDLIDVQACAQAGIVVCNVRGYAVNTVPEHVFALILALRRSIVGYRQDVINRRWQEAGQFCFHTHSIKELAGSTLGIMGAGVLGQAVAKLGQAFGMKTLFAAHKGVSGQGGLYAPFEQVLRDSDVISVNAPLNDATRNMLAMPEFEQMTRQPVIINCSRGGLVNERDLVGALNRGLIGGIGFDVLTSEPPADDNPLLSVLDRPDVIVTPHVAWASQEGMQTGWNQLIGHIESFQSGVPSNVVS